MLFWLKTGVSENNSGRECCWPYLIGQHPLSPVFGQKRPGAPDLKLLCSASTRFWPCDVPLLAILYFFPVGYSTTRTDQHGPQKQLTAKFRPGVEIDNFCNFSCNNFEVNHLSPCLSGGCSEASLDAFGLATTPARTPTKRTYKQILKERCA